MAIKTLTQTLYQRLNNAIIRTAITDYIIKMLGNTGKYYRNIKITLHKIGMCYYVYIPAKGVSFRFGQILRVLEVVYIAYSMETWCNLYCV